MVNFDQLKPSERLSYRHAGSGTRFSYVARPCFAPEHKMVRTAVGGVHGRRKKRPASTTACCRKGGTQEMRRTTRNVPNLEKRASARVRRGSNPGPVDADFGQVAPWRHRGKRPSARARSDSAKATNPHPATPKLIATITRKPVAIAGVPPKSKSGICKMDKPAISAVPSARSVPARTNSSVRPDERESDRSTSTPQVRPRTINQPIVKTVSRPRPIPKAPIKSKPASPVMPPEPSAALPTTLCRSLQPIANSAKPPARSIPPTHGGSGRFSIIGKPSANAAIEILTIPPARIPFHGAESSGLASACPRGERGKLVFKS